MSQQKVLLENAPKPQYYHYSVFNHVDKRLNLVNKITIFVIILLSIHKFSVTACSYPGGYAGAYPGGYAGAYPGA